MNRDSIRRSIRYGLALSCLTMLVLALLPAKTAAPRHMHKGVNLNKYHKSFQLKKVPDPMLGSAK
jgi:hypothetical protein